MRPFVVSLPILLLALPVRSQEAAPGRADKPNIVYILADDLGYGELGCYGQQKIRTPRLDALAAQGMRFSQHYTGAPVCAPARCVLMTGKHSGRTTIRDNREHKPEGQEPIGGAEVTLAEMLREQGYATGGFGKWGLGFPGSEGDPLAQGFDHFFGYNCQRHAHNFYPTYLWDDDRRIELAGNTNGRTGETYAHDVIVDAALAFLRANKDRPFFLYAPFTLPHLALQAPDEAIAEYRGKWEETPYRGNSYQHHDTPRACYAAMITHLDKTVGLLLDELERLGLSDQTLVLFSSDNGPTHLPAQVDVEFFASAGGFRGLKGSVYEGGIRVPMVARWPGKIAPGSVCDHACMFDDVMPTLAGVAKCAVPAAATGTSFLPSLLGRPEDQEPKDELFWDFPGYGGQLALRHGKWKAVARGMRKDPDAKTELYDLDADPKEAVDLAAQHPERAAQMRRRMVELRVRPKDAAFVFGAYSDS